MRTIIDKIMDLVDCLYTGSDYGCIFMFVVFMILFYAAVAALII